MSQSSQTSQHAGMPQTTDASQVNNLQIYMSQLSQPSHQGGQALLEAAGNLECGTTDVNTCVPTVAIVTSEKASMSSYEDLLLTPMGRVTIEQAHPSDLDSILDILEEAACWLISRGIDQWQPGVFRRVRCQSIADQVSRGEVYLARRDGQAVGT